MLGNTLVSTKRLQRNHDPPSASLTPWGGLQSLDDTNRKPTC